MFNEAVYIANWKAAHHRYEIFSYSKFKPALDEQVKAVSNHVKLYGGISHELADMLIRKEPIEKAYKEVYVKIGTIQAGSTLRFINQLGRSMSQKSSPPGFFSEKWNRLMELFFTARSSTRISDVTETTREKVRRVLADSENMTTSERATYIVDTLDDPDFNRSRALMIARTESTSAANYGASLGNADADYMTNKRWLAVMDQNTRPDHVDANGQTVANDEFFVVGGSECMYPGDVSLPANEVINCRCCVVYVPVIEDGMAVFREAA